MPPFEPDNTATIGTVIHHGFEEPAGMSIDELEALEAETDATRRGFANVIRAGLMRLIREFEAKLKPDEEIGAYLASFGAQRLIHIEGVGFENPFLISFRGVDDDGRKVELVQHTSQLNVLFVPIAIEPPQKPRRITGFQNAPAE